MAVFALGFLLQVASLGMLSDSRADTLFGDEIDYWQLGGRVEISLLRPPGYPLIVALAERISPHSPFALFLLQSLTLSFRPLIILLLLRAHGAERRLSVALATASALSFTALALPKRVLADSWLGLLVPLAFLGLIRAAKRPGSWGLGGIASGAGLALKPILQVWFLAAPIALRILGLRGAALAQRSLMVVSLPALVLLSGIVLNSFQRGSAVFSLIGEVTVLRYWVPATLCLHDTGGRWDDGCLVAVRDEWSAPAWALASGDAHLREDSMRKAREVLRRYPGRAAQALAMAAWKNFPRPFFPSELGVLFEREVSALAWRVGKVLTYLLWAAALAGGARLFSLPTTRSATAAAALFLAIFSLATAISHSEGARLMFPVEWVLFVFPAGVLVKRPETLVSERLE